MDYPDTRPEIPRATLFASITNKMIMPTLSTPKDALAAYLGSKFVILSFFRNTPQLAQHTFCFFAEDSFASLYSLAHGVGVTQCLVDR